MRKDLENFADHIQNTKKSQIKDTAPKKHELKKNKKS